MVDLLKVCNTEMEDKCPEFEPPTPRMTDDEFSVAQKDLLKDLPDEFRAALSYMAYEQGHSSGNEDKLNCLRTIVGHLKQPILDYEKRINER